MNSFKDLPFNVTLLSADSRRLMLTRPTTSTDIYDSATGGFNENGLYSTLTFGNVNTEERSKLFSYIDLNTTLIHPFIFRQVLKLNGNYSDLIAKKKTYIWDEEDKDFVPSIADGSSNGYGFFMEHYLDIEFKSTKSDKRELKIELLNKFRKDSLLKNHLIIPAGLRELEIDDNNREVEDEINPLYRKLLAISKSIEKDELSENDSIYDNSRWRMQETIEEIFDLLYRLVTGKRGFIQKKFARRRVFDSTRNVITSMDTSAAVMNGPKQIKAMDTQFGLFQTLRGVLPLAVNLLRNDWVINAVSEESEYAELVNTKTLKLESVKLSLKSLNNWGSTEGLEKMIMSFRYPSKRHKFVTIDGKYIGLIYQDEKHIKFFNRIEELPETFDRTNVRGITWGELFYHSLYKKIEDIFAIVTRYPVTGEGSTYPSHAYVKTTIDSLTLTELDDNWNETEIIYYEWPNVQNKSEWFDTMSPASIRLALLGADFDGDTMSASFIYSNEAIEECKALLNSKRALINPNGELFHGIVTDLCEWTLLNLTR